MCALGTAIVLVVCHLGTGCGGSPPPPAETPAPASEDETPMKPEGEAAPTADPAASDSKSADGDASSEAAKGEGGDAPTGKLEGRDVTYRPTSNGLVIEVDGVKLEPTPQMKPKSGGHQLTLSMRATSTDGKLHHFLKSAKGALMVAGELDRGGKKERFTDERTGDAQEVLGPDASIELTQTIEQTVFGNQTLTLHVGLWGLGREGDERRPVRKLFIVKVVPGSRKPTAVIIPPD